jgi:hypothetical protein
VTVIQVPATRGDALVLASKLFAQANAIMDSVVNYEPVDIADVEGIVERPVAIEYARHVRETAVGYLQWAQLARDLDADARRALR